MKSITVLIVIQEYMILYEAWNRAQKVKWTSWEREFTGECQHSCERYVYDTRICIGENRYCDGTFVKSHLEQCKEGSCLIVNGNWGSWHLQSKGSCTVTCGYGYRNIHFQRVCDNPAPKGQGLTCQGEEHNIFKERCIVRNGCEDGVWTLDGGWSLWMGKTTGMCYGSCGVGIRFVFNVRTCDSPPPTGAGAKYCRGSENKVATENCLKEECVVNGGWNSWFLQRVKKCGFNCQQEVIHQRLCINPAPSPSGAPCPGDSQRVDDRDCCDKDTCNRAQWTEWSTDFSDVCSHKCERYIYNSRQCVGKNCYCYGTYVKSRVEKCREDSCETVHGAWGEWEVTAKGHCTVTCGYGNKYVAFQRKCNNPAPIGQGLPCQGDHEDIRKRMCFVIKHCEKGNRSLDGEWSHWLIQLNVPCDVTCGIGNHTVPFFRRCINPPPQNGGKECLGREMKTVIQKCHGLKECIVNGGWNEWILLRVEKCGFNCQQEVIHKRLCTNPAPSPSGAPCAGQSQRVSYRDCCKNKEENKISPDINGPLWTLWTTVNDVCESSCERHVYEVRECVGKNRYCFGVFVKSRLEQCSEDACKIVHGVWSRWIIIKQKPCSVTCGYGYATVYVRRVCKPVGQGVTCHGPKEKLLKQACKRLPCKNGYGSLDGDWSEWMQRRYIPCVVTCGTGNQKIPYIRFCNNPIPKNGGKKCDGPNEKTEMRKCFRGTECFVNGGWSQWFIRTVAKCDLNCQQKVIRRRLCTNPAPSPSGSPCPGYSKSVNYRDCCEKHPMNGAQWSSWRKVNGVCRHSCQRYFYNTRKCIGPNIFCFGVFVTSGFEQCKQDSCKTVHGGWGSWEIITQELCGVTCGYGYKHVYIRRECNRPKPEGQGLTCQGQREQIYTIKCFVIPNCHNKNGYGSLDSHWFPWIQKAYGPCNVTCGIGYQIVSYFRLCDNPGSRKREKQCTGPNNKSVMQKCSSPKDCIVNGGWNVWFIERVAQCNSNSCKQAVTYKRLCTNPAPSPSGSPCLGDSQSLSYRNCCKKIDGGWGSWFVECQESCTAKCQPDMVMVSVVRECNRPVPQLGGNDCVGNSSKPHMEPCHVTNPVATSVAGEDIIDYGDEVEPQSKEPTYEDGFRRKSNEVKNQMNEPTNEDGFRRKFITKGVYLGVTGGLTTVLAGLVIASFICKKRIMKSEVHETGLKCPLYKNKKEKDKEFMSYDNPVSQNEEL